MSDLDAQDERVWRGISLLAKAERRAWRRGFHVGAVFGAAALAVGFLLEAWLR